MIRPTDLWVVAEALHAPEPSRASLASASAARRRLMVRLIVNLVGGGGFIALLVAANQLPWLATPLRVAAMLWFAALLAVKFALWSSMDRDDARRPRQRRPN